MKLSELERNAYIAGDTDTTDLLAMLMDERETSASELEDMEKERDTETVRALQPVLTLTTLT